MKGGQLLAISAVRNRGRVKVLRTLALVQTNRTSLLILLLPKGMHHSLLKALTTLPFPSEECTEGSYGVSDLLW